MNISQKVALSYLRHLLALIVGAIVIVANFEHISPWQFYQFTIHDWILAANAFWIAALPQLRFGVEPWLKAYLKRRYPSAFAVGLIDEIFGYAEKALDTLTPVNNGGSNVHVVPPAVYTEERSTTI